MNSGMDSGSDLMMMMGSGRGFLGGSTENGKSYYSIMCVFCHPEIQIAIGCR